MKRNHIIFSIIALAALLFGSNTAWAQQSWDFTAKLGSTDENNMKADNNWYYDSSKSRYSYTAALTQQALTANSKDLNITIGLLFTCKAVSSGEGNIRFESGKRMWLAGAATPVVIPGLKKGQEVSISYMTSSSSTARGITPTNLSGTSGFDASTATQTGKGQVTEDGDVVLTPTGGIYVYSITVGAAPDPDETIITPAETGSNATDTSNNSVTRNMNANQMQVELLNGDLKYYNTDEVNAVDIDREASTVSVTNYQGATDTYRGSVSNISFARGLDQGDEGDITNNGVVITTAKGWLESVYAKWQPYEGAESYAVYVKGGQYSSYTKVDAQLVRDYGSYGRVDVVGLKKASDYALKVVPIIDGAEDETKASTAENMTVENYSREGFAHLNYSGVGAYNNDGTLKSGAKVFYVTKNTAKTITTDVITNSKGATTTFTGLQDIINAYQKGYDTTPITFRILGKVSEGDIDRFDSSEEGLQVKGKNADSEMNITIEGIGEDATLSGFGFLVRNCASVEFRNFALMLFKDDGISIDTDNSHIWVHNIDFFYGKTGSDSDQAKGDGTVDIKGDSKYVTVDYCHFWDSGKSSLCGMKSESGPNYITYHHNWFDHSDSRHARVRTMTVHIWNNYYDGVSKYGAGATTGSSLFVESNYFRGTNKPMLISMQGTDIAGGNGTFSGEDGGIIKSYGNAFVEKTSNFKYVTYQQNNVEFDAYEATSRDEKVPSTVTAKQGGGTYNNFDTNSSLMYAYEPDAAADVPAVVVGYYGAGRLNHGDFTWSFDGKDNDYEVDSALKTALENYTSKLVGIFGGDQIGGGTEGGGGSEEGGGDTPQPQGDVITCNFQVDSASNSFFTVSGNTSDSKGTVTVDGVNYTVCLKMESSTSVKFTTTEEMTLTLYFVETAPTIKIDGTKYTGSNGIITQTLTAGSHELTKANTANLFYIKLEK